MARHEPAPGSPEEALFRAAREGDPQAFQEALRQGADPNARSSHASILACVSALEDPGFAKALLAAGALPSFGHHPLSPPNVAAREGRSQILLLLLDAIEARDPGSKEPHLVHLAARHNSVDCLRLLIERGAVDATPPEKPTNIRPPLCLAAGHGHLECVDLLIHAGVDLAAEHLGHTCASFAAQNGHADCLGSILRAGFPTDMIHANGHTLASRAAQFGRIQCLSTLLEFGADLAQPCLDGSLPMEIALAHGHADAHVFIFAAVERERIAGSVPRADASPQSAARL